jgi:sodium pump decarboxylase gamma subunit
MIIEGAKLTLLGMLVVFLFLTILILMVKLSALLLKNFSAKEAAERKTRSGRTTSDLLAEDRKLAGIISAALAAHRARYRNQA